MIKVWAKPIRVNKSSQDKRAADVGANLFIGNLDPDVDEKAGPRAHLHTHACADFPDSLIAPRHSHMHSACQACRGSACK